MAHCSWPNWLKSLLLCASRGQAWALRHWRRRRRRLLLRSLRLGAEQIGEPATARCHRRVEGPQVRRLAKSVQSFPECTKRPKQSIERPKVSYAFLKASQRVLNTLEAETSYSVPNGQLSSTLAQASARGTRCPRNGHPEPFSVPGGLRKQLKRFK